MKRPQTHRLGIGWLLVALLRLGGIDPALAEIGRAADTVNAALLPRAVPLVGLKGEVASLILAGRPGGAFGISSTALPSLEHAGTAEVWLEIDGAQLLAAASPDQVPADSPLAVLPDQVPAESPLAVPSRVPSSPDQVPGDSPLAVPSRVPSQVPPDSPSPSPSGQVLDGEVLDGEVPADSLDLEIYAYALDLQNQVPAYFATRTSVDLAAWGEFLHATGLRFCGLLQGLPAGTYRLRVLVRLPGTGRFALDELELRIPDIGSESAFAYAQPGTGHSWLRIESPAALSSAATHSALPLLYLAQPNHLELFASHGLLEHPATARLLRDTDKKTLTVAEASLVWTAEATTQALGQRRSAALMLPALAAGSYWLEIELAQGQITPRRQVFVIGAELAREAASWPQVSRLASTLSSTPTTAEDRTTTPDQDPGRWRLGKAYGEVLDLLASGAAKQAGNALNQLERRAALRHGTPWGPLLEHQARLHQRLARRQPESLPPIVLLHLEQHDHNVRHRRFAFATASRTKIVELTRLYAAHSTSEQAPALAAHALTALGMYLHAASLWQPGEALLEEALTLDPDNPAARLQLAIFHEAHGRHDRAARFLQPLARTSTRLEPRVRLAINWRRTDQLARAEELLRTVIDELGHELDPYLTLAYQELADLYLDSGRDRAAASLLEAALGRLPSSPRIRLQLAFIYDHQERSNDSRAQLAALGREARQEGAGQPSARFLYNRGWQQENRRPRQEFERGARARLGALAAALGGEER